jgi:hypothetical protein
METTNWRGFTYTWTGTHWSPPEAQLMILNDIVSGPRILRPSDDQPATNLPPSGGDLWWDGLGLQLYCWHIDATGIGSWVATGNTGGSTDVYTDLSLSGNGAPATPLSVRLVDGTQY